MDSETDSDDEKCNTIMQKPKSDVEIALETTWQNKWIDYIWSKIHVIADKNKIREFNIYSTTYNTAFANHLRSFSALYQLASNRPSFDVNIDFIPITSFWTCPCWTNSGYGFTLNIGGDTFTRILHKHVPRYDFKQIYVTHHMKWLNLLAIYDDYRKNPYTHITVTNGERIVYDDYLLQKLIQY